MNKRKKNLEKGITLIALVITIIVLLILAGVSIAMLTGDNGILTKATEAKQNTEKAEIEEQVRLAVNASYDNSGNLDNAQLKDNLNKIEGITKINDTITFPQTVTIDGYQVAISDDGTVSDATKTGETTEEKQLAKDVLKTNPDGENLVSKSPYVMYNGMLCRVLYDATTDLGPQIITTESVDTVTLGADDPTVSASDFEYTGSAHVDDNFKKASVSYNNAIDTLNDKAKEYLDNGGIANYARCLGSKQSSFTERDNAHMYVSGYEYHTKYKMDNLFKTLDSNYEKDVEKLNNLELNSSGHEEGTCLASRNIKDYAAGANYHIRYVDPAGNAESLNLSAFSQYGNVNSHSETLGFRPIFAISLNAKIAGGTGTSDNPYILEL